MEVVLKNNKQQTELACIVHSVSRHAIRKWWILLSLQPSREHSFG